MTREELGQRAQSVLADLAVRGAPFTVKDVTDMIGEVPAGRIGVLLRMLQKNGALYHPTGNRLQWAFREDGLHKLGALTLPGRKIRKVRKVKRVRVHPAMKLHHEPEHVKEHGPLVGALFVKQTKDGVGEPVQMMDVPLQALIQAAIHLLEHLNDRLFGPEGD